MHALISDSNIYLDLNLFMLFAMSIRTFFFYRIITSRLTHRDIHIFMGKGDFVFTDIGRLLGTSSYYPSIVMNFFLTCVIS